MNRKKLCFLVSFALACSSCGHRKDKVLEGVWLRQGDAFEGTIVEFAYLGGKTLEGRLYAVNHLASEYGFRVGDLKIKNVVPVSKGLFRAMDLNKGNNAAIVEYVEIMIEMVSSKELSVRHDTWTPQDVGSFQHWKKLPATDTRMSAYHTGKADLAEHLGKWRDAESARRTALELSPETGKYLNALAWLLAACPDDSVRSPEEAIKLAKRANTLTNDKNASFLDTLAAAYAASGDFDKAVDFQQQAVDLLDTPSGDCLGRLDLYKNHKSYVLSKP